MNDPRGDLRRPKDINGKRFYSTAYVRHRGRWRRLNNGDIEVLKFLYDETYLDMSAAKPSRFIGLIRRTP